ncbi:hypothetical protein [Bacteroides sp. 51]|uniref:hypothetical protein n=1 Tax=Bacteroides sp. 51 TaxID=2302938 RepID=UPI0013D7F381|nr:hypothetical protein [Bacteroides sp. 51]NDV82436.1 hypothetical protein [Bacteroides sp. 51]
MTLLSATTVCAQHKVKPFEHLSFSVNAGTLGVGVQVAAPVNQYLSLRTGLMMFTYTYNYDYDGEYEGYNYEVPMKAKANMVNGLLLADVFPFRNKRFHVTGGFYMGTSDIIKVSAKAEIDYPIEIGGILKSSTHFDFCIGLLPQKSNANYLKVQRKNLFPLDFSGKCVELFK